MIYGMGYGQAQCACMHGLVPCCGQDGYRAQVPQHPIDSYNYTNTYHTQRKKEI